MAHVTRPRRNHRKSRKGCMECKRRHVKCDERRPVCVNCATSHRQCCYADQGPIILNNQPSHRTCAATGLATEAELPLLGSINPLVCPLSASHGLGQYFTLQHLLLLDHVERNMTNWLMVTEEMRPIARAYIDYALITPYLMDQLLAVSARHLSTMHLDRSDLYRRQAAQLQARALDYFNKSKEDMSDRNIVSMFLFSSLLPVNILAEKLISHRESFSTFLDGFVDYLRLHRGARVMCANSWDVLRKTEFKQWFNITDKTAAGDIPLRELETLSRMLQSSDLNQKSIEACQTAKESLEFVNLRLQGPKSWGVHALMAWSSLISVDFIHLLQKRTPEALIILAYYASLFHQFRDFWVFGDAGEYLVRNISEVLGRHWAEWLETPRWFLGI